MKIEITRQTICNGKRANIGDVVEVSVKDARFLTAIKKAKPAEKATAVKKSSTKKSVKK